MNKPLEFWRISTYEDEIRAEARKEVMRKGLVILLFLSNLFLAVKWWQAVHP